MRTRGILMVCVALASGAAGGRGTAANLSDHRPWPGANPQTHRPFGDVRTDLECAGELLTLPSTTFEGAAPR